MDEKLIAELANIKSALETKTAVEVKAAIDAFEVKALTANKASFEAELKEVKEAMELKFMADIKAVQDHADKLDIKLQKANRIDASVKSFNDVLANAISEKTSDIEAFRDKKSKSFSLELKAVGDITTGNVTGGTRYGELMNPNIIDRPTRKVHMDEIVPSGSIGAGNSFTFMRETGLGEGQIQAVLEGATKSQFDLDLEEATVQVETIAGWLRITRKAMSNIPGMISFLQRRLPQKFRDALDNYILYGTGVTPQIKGILAAGNFKASTATITLPLIEKLIHDVATLEDVYERNATGILLRPSDYYSFFLNKASGSGEYDLPQGVTIVNGRLMMLGIPAYATTAIQTPDYVVGDWEGVQLLTQEAMRIEFFEQDADNVTKNKVTIRIEGNYALPVYGDDYFIKGTTAQA